MAALPPKMVASPPKMVASPPKTAQLPTREIADVVYPRGSQRRPLSATLPYPRHITKHTHTHLGRLSNGHGLGEVALALLARCRLALAPPPLHLHHRRLLPLRPPALVSAITRPELVGSRTLDGMVESYLSTPHSTVAEDPGICYRMMWEDTTLKPPEGTSARRAATLRSLAIASCSCPPIPYLSTPHGPYHALPQYPTRPPPYPASVLLSVQYAISVPLTAHTTAQYPTRPDHTLAQYRSLPRDLRAYRRSVPLNATRYPNSAPISAAAVSR
eukprot:1154898-Rhodomonas_salina.3